MGIYSANRTGRLDVSQIKANESYTATDFGRIMYESAVNDKIVFESILANDFNEIKAMREGTLLESEVKALNEKSAKEFFKMIKTRVMEFFGKIKGAIKNAINWVSAHILKNGKALVKEFNEKNSKHTYAGQKFSVKTKIRTDFDPMPKFEAKSVTDIKDYINKEKVNKDVDKSALVSWELYKLLQSAGCKNLGTTGLSPAEYKAKVFEASFEDKTLNSSDSSIINKMLDVVGNVTTSVKELKKKEKTVQKVIQQVSAEIKAAEQDMDRGENPTTTASEAITSINLIVSALETMTTTVISTQIKVVNTEVKLYSKALKSIMGYMHEGAVMDVEDIDASVDAEVDSDMEIVPGETLDAETQLEVDDIVDAVESKCC